MTTIHTVIEYIHSQVSCVHLVGVQAQSILQASSRPTTSTTTNSTTTGRISSSHSVKLSLTTRTSSPTLTDLIHMI